MIFGTRRTAVVSALLWTIAVFLVPYGAAQEPIQLPAHLEEDQYIIELNRVFDEWNSKDLVLPPKSALESSLTSRLNLRVERPAYAYQTPDWAAQMQAQFDDMPAEVVPEKTLSVASRAMLVLLFARESVPFKRQVALENMRSQLELPLFLLLGHAQRIAAEDIDPPSLVASLAYWWTGVWPFCGPDQSTEQGR